MPTPRWIEPVFALMLVLVLAGAVALAQSPAPPAAAPGAAAQPNPPENHLPQSIKQSYSQAEQAGEEPSAPAAAPETPEHSPWLDGVHYLGLGGGGLMVVNLILGATLYFGTISAKRLPIPVRKGRRKWHFTVGLIALSLAALHGGLRYVQAGGFDLGNPPAFALACAAVLLACSGMIRAWPPRRLARYAHRWMWLHRALVLAAVLLLAAHVTGQVMIFLAHHGAA
jgi:hypothetical protein